MSASGAKPGASGTGAEIIKKITNLETMVEEMDKSFKSQFIEMLNKQNELKLQIASLSVAKSRSPGSKTGTGSSTSSTAAASNANVKTKPINSMYWLKILYGDNKDEVLKKYFNEHIEDLNKYIEDDESAKEKVGPARVEVEFKYLWNTYVRPKECLELKKKILKNYQKWCEEFDKAHLTPVSKDSESKDETKEEETE